MTQRSQNKGIIKKYARKLACAQLASARGRGAKFPYSAVEEKMAHVLRMGVQKGADDYQGSMYRIA
jgi:hypothetical protein